MSGLTLKLLHRRTLAHRLRHGELRLQIGPFVACLRSPLPALVEDLTTAYADFPVAENDGFADFHVELLPEYPGAWSGPLRRWLPPWSRPQARFHFDGRPPALPARRSALAALEAGLNWCISNHVHQYLVLRAAALERGGMAVLLPGGAGAGKSTLAAALALRGWRLMSDELTLLDLGSGMVQGMARPICLNHEGLAAVRRLAPRAALTGEVDEPGQGRQALLRPPVTSVTRMQEAAWPAWLVLPAYTPGQPARLQAHSPAETFMQLASQAANYHVHGLRGFRALGSLLDQCACHRLTYSRLEEAVPVLDQLALRTPCPPPRHC